mmetsp:Transcript_13760/g.51495  ORF Transcript_13760/g.51495 Transcript_13760/m.51495 type:complete len:256 (+) Transcript_13760:1010-1777(+)
MVFSLSSSALNKFRMTPFCFVDPSGSFFVVGVTFRPAYTPAFITALPIVLRINTRHLNKPPTARLALRNSRLFTPRSPHASATSFFVKNFALALSKHVSSSSSPRSFSLNDGLGGRASSSSSSSPPTEVAAMAAPPKPPNAAAPGAPNKPGAGAPAPKGLVAAFGNSDGFSVTATDATTAAPKPLKRLGAGAAGSAALGGVGADATPKSGFALIGVPEGTPPKPPSVGVDVGSAASSLDSSTSLKSVVICPMCLR